MSLSHNRNFSRREKPRTAPEYATVKGEVCGSTHKAILITNETLNAPTWVPFFKMETVSAIRAAKALRGDMVSLLVELPFAEDNKLV